MKTFRALLTVGAAVASLTCPHSLFADTTTVVPQDPNGAVVNGLQGVPDNIKQLIVSFDVTADKSLASQRLLLIKLKNATTPEEREAIREQLQDNRQAFLADLKAFRQQLKNDLTALEGKISHAEFRRIIDAAKDAASGGLGDRHKGHN
jgi:hypothetical protein